MIPLASTSVRAYSSAIIRAANSFPQSAPRQVEDGERGPQLQFSPNATSCIPQCATIVITKFVSILGAC